VLGTLSNQMRLDWRSLAKSSQTCTSLRRTGQCPVLRLAHATNSLLSGKVGGGGATIIHRIVRCAPTIQWASCARANGRQRNQRATRDLRQRSPGYTGLSGVPRGSWLQQSALPKKEGDRTLFTVQWCTGLSGVLTKRRQLWPSKWSSNGS
jgi:hypothetical protein